MHQSVATIDSPEFLNLQPLDINPLMSKCDIKVLYVGANRNKSFISEEVATEIGKTLRGAPIVGYFRDTKEDFTDHGEKIIIDDEGIKFQCQTVPYGFVSPDADVWFQNFEDFDNMGNSVVHKYLMTTGYLWTDQFPESSLPVEEGRPQSMQLKSESVHGQWEQNIENGMEFFIINDAIIQKICILGDDVEPCFEGASITAPNVSAKFTLDDKFKHTLYSMMNDLKNALKKEGGQQMLDTEIQNVETEFTEEVSDSFSENENSQSAPNDYAKNKEDQDKKSETSKEEEDTDKEDTSEDKENSNEEKDDEKEKKDKKYTILESDFSVLKDKFEELQQQYSNLQASYEELMNFKRTVDTEKKDALIAEFYMLSSEDKKDVIENKDKYSLDEIKAKLAVICFDKKINFSLDNQNEEVVQENITTFNLNNDENNSLPEWVKAVKEQEKNYN